VFFLLACISFTSRITPPFPSRVGSKYTQPQVQTSRRLSFCLPTLLLFHAGCDIPRPPPLPGPERCASTTFFPSHGLPCVENPKEVLFSLAVTVFFGPPKTNGILIFCSLLSSLSPRKACQLKVIFFLTYFSSSSSHLRMQPFT